MKMARIALNDMGLLKSLEIKNLSPGLNWIVGPTGSGKTTIRRAIGGLLYGFDETSRRRLFEDRNHSARGELDLVIGDRGYQLQRHQANWNGSAEALRSLDNGVANQSLSRNLGDLHATDYFTFFNLSLIDSPDLERRMVRSLTTRLGVSAGQGHWSSENEYLLWREQAQARRQSLDTLEAHLRQLISRRDRLQHELDAAQRNYQQRVRELDQQIELTRHSITDLEQRLSESQTRSHELELQIEHLRSEIYRLRNQKIQTVVPALRPEPVHDSLAELHRRLDRVQREIKRARAAERDVYHRRSEIRDQRLALSQHESKTRNPALIGARQQVANLEQRIEDLSREFGEAARTDREHYGPLPPTVSRESGLHPAEQLKQAREDLYALCQDLSRYHLETQRGRLRAESRDLRRCAHELKRRLSWLKLRRTQVLSDIKAVDPAGHELIVRGEKRFCDCAKHAGHLAARRQFLHDSLLGEAGPMDGNAAYSQTIAAPVDTSDLERQLQGLLNEYDRLLLVIQNLQNDLVRRRSDLENLLSERDRLRSLDVEHLRSELSEVQVEIRALESQLTLLRAEVTKDNPLWNLRYDNLLERASALCRKMTEGQVQQVWIDGPNQRLVVRENHGKQRSFDSLSRADQDQVCLSVCLAVGQRLADAGTHVPMVFDDLFANLDDARSRSTRDVLEDFVIGGQQFVLLANGRQLGDRFMSARLIDSHRHLNAVFTLPDFQASENSISWPVVLLPGSVAKPLALPQPVIATPVLVTPKTNGLITEHTRLAELDLIERESLQVLADHDITLIGHLLDVDPEILPHSLTSCGIVSSRIDRWQSQAWLLCCVPGLRPYDVRLLVGSGINEPEMLAELSAHDVLNRLESYLATNEGQRVMRSGTDYELARVNSWMRSLRENQSSWRNHDKLAGNSRAQRRRDVRHRSPYGTLRQSENSRVVPTSSRLETNRNDDPREREGLLSRNLAPRGLRTYDASVKPNSLPRTQFANTEFGPRDSQPRDFDPYHHNHSGAAVRIHQAREDFDREKNRLAAESNGNHSLTFYLNLKDDLEKAPSIGPRMAESFAAIGIRTVEQFLAAQPEDMAQRLGRRRVDGKMLSDWQHQSRLVCRIPNLRGHDAQLLVACDFFDPETIMSMNPKELFATIVPFSESPDGKKILRNSKAPDMAEINDWIAWAKNHRSLQVA